jgi:hypothetical protein
MTERLAGRNHLGQRVRPRRLRPDEKEAIVQSIESAMSRGEHYELRVFWNERGIFVAPLAVQEKVRVGPPG